MKKFFFVLLTSLLAFSSSLRAEPESQPHLWLDALGGSLDGNSIYGGVARYFTPISDELLTQLELSCGELDGDPMWGTTAHLFRRGSRGLLGILGVFSQLDGEIERYQVGIEGEVYFERFTISSAAGWQKQNGGISPFFNDEDDAGFGIGLFRWYADDNLQVKAGLILDDVNVRFNGGVEKQLVFTTLPGDISGFIDFIVGEEHYESIICGIRYRFGTHKTLKKHHREDGILPIRE